MRFVYGRYRQPTAVPGISLYEASNENDKGDTGDSDESERCAICGFGNKPKNRPDFLVPCRCFGLY